MPNTTALDIANLARPTRYLRPNDSGMIALPKDLDGTHGTNRSDHANQLGASNDLEAIQLFLQEYSDSPATLRTYTKEIERLLLWAWSVPKKPLSSLDRADFAAYSAFMANPEPHHVWCGPRRGCRGKRHEAGWRPFVGPMNQAAQRLALIIINTLMRYLVQAEYLRANPLGLMRRQKHTGSPLDLDPTQRVSERAFDNQEWGALVATLDDASLDEQWDGRLRSRYLVALLYFLALRVGELTSHTMGHFRQLRGLWFFFVVGKGNKPAQLPVCDALLAELQAFRRSLGLVSLPAPNESMPLFPQRSGLGAIGPRRINQLIAELMHYVSLRVAPTDKDKADHLRRASAHWFRHTALTRQAQAGASLAHLKANARHSRIDTTMIYVHTEEHARHAEMQRHGWLSARPV